MHRYISSVCALLVAMLVAQSCVESPYEGSDGSDSFDAPVVGQAYEGVWQMDDRKENGIVVAYPGYFDALDIPYAWLAANIFAGSDVKGVVGSDAGGRLGYSMATTQDGTTLYTLKPKVWRMTATVDGRNRQVALYMAPQAGGTDDMSWGRISKSGVMSIMLCVTGYSLDGADMQPSVMRLTFTAMRK